MGVKQALVFVCFSPPPAVWSSVHLVLVSSFHPLRLCLWQVVPKPLSQQESTDGKKSSSPHTHTPTLNDKNHTFWSSALHKLEVTMYFRSLLWPLCCRKASSVLKLPSIRLLEESAHSIKHVYLTHSYTHPSKQDWVGQSPWRSSQVCLSFPILSLSWQGLFFCLSCPHETVCSLCLGFGHVTQWLIPCKQIKHIYHIYYIPLLCSHKTHHVMFYVCLFSFCSLFSFFAVWFIVMDFQSHNSCFKIINFTTVQPQCFCKHSETG